MDRTPSHTTSNKRIAKNTLLLYMRMVIILVIGLYTSRVVLSVLGVEDYGLYNVVGGFVSLFTFLNGAMTTATQRFITFELAQGSLDRQRLTFSTALIIHFGLALLIFVLAETIGLWMVYNKLVIPVERFGAALWVYHLSVITCMVSVISIPYNAMIIAHEKMSAFAYISIMDVALKLIVVFLLAVSPWDKLIFYALGLFLIQMLDRMLYGIYCRRHFEEASFRFRFDKNIFKEMTNIAGWSLFGNIAGIGYTQGLNILLNMFFGPVVNAARGVAVTVQGIVCGFVANFQMALNPQITKSYAVKDLDRMHSLIYSSSKFSFYLLFIIVFPIILETDYILTLWLKNVPEYTITFLRLILCIMLVDTLANPLMVSSQATGKVKVYQSVVGGLLLLIVPIAYVVLKMGGNPQSVFIIHLLVAIVAQFARLVIIGRLIEMSISHYLRKVIAPILGVTFLSVIMVLMLKTFILHGVSPIINIAIYLFTSTVFMLEVGLSKGERTRLFSLARKVLKK